MPLEWDKYCQLKITLEAQTPLILFHNQPGATLRASEVKPKLDRYLYLFIGQQEEPTVEELEKDGFIQNNQLANGRTHKALNYKMQIRVSRTSNWSPSPIDNSYPCFYGADNEDNATPRHILICDVDMIITCFSKLGRNLIKEHIEDFFLTTNFGLRQNKGFGSFARSQLTVNDSEKEIDSVDSETLIKRCASKLKERLNSNVCLYADLSELNTENQFRWISHFSRIMKSGINYPHKGLYIKSFLFRYYLNQTPSIGNEKAWIKSHDSLLVFSRNGRTGDRSQKEINYFLRAYFGFSNSSTFMTNHNRITVKNEINDTSTRLTTIKRLPSHIYFKIVRNHVFILATPYETELANRAFKFYRDEARNLIPEISTPPAFDGDSFLTAYQLELTSNEKGSIGEILQGVSNYRDNDIEIMSKLRNVRLLN